MIHGDELKGRILSTLAVLSFTILMFCIKSCKAKPLSLAMYRAVGNVIIINIHSKVSSIDLFVCWENLYWCLLRSSIGGFAILTCNYGPQLISISLFFVVSRLQTIVLTMMGVVFLGNAFSWKILLVGLITMFGVVLVLAPELLGLRFDGDKGIELTWTPEEILGIMMSIAFIFTDSGAYTVLSRASGKVSSTQSIFYLNLGLVFVTAILMIMSGYVMEFYLDEVWKYVLLAVGYYIGQQCFSIGANLEKNMGVLAVIQSLSVVFSLSIDILFCDYHVSIVNIIGSVIVVSSSAYTIVLYNKSK